MPDSNVGFKIKEIRLAQKMTLKELAEHGYCSIPEYDLSDEQVEQNGRLWWACTCAVRNWNIRKTGLSTTKKGAKKYAAYLEAGETALEALQPTEKERSLIVDHPKLLLIWEFMEAYGYEKTFENEKFVIYE